MKSQITDKTTIYRKEYNGRTFYSATISKKLQDGNWENTTIGIQFPKSVDLRDKTKIDIKKAWLTFYLKDKKPTFYIFCTEFDILEEPQDENQIPDGFYTDGGPGFSESSDDIPF